MALHTASAHPRTGRLIGSRRIGLVKGCGETSHGGRSLISREPADGAAGGASPVPDDSVRSRTAPVRSYTVATNGSFFRAPWHIPAREQDDAMAGFLACGSQHRVRPSRTSGRPALGDDALQWRDLGADLASRSCVHGALRLQLRAQRRTWRTIRDFSPDFRLTGFPFTLPYGWHHLAEF